MLTTTVNQKYLEIERPVSKIVAIKSPKGSGKTNWLKDNLSDESTLYISHRVALVGDIARRNDAANYQEGSTAYNSKRLVITLDSLPALFYNDIHQGATVVIDEATQVLRHLTGDTLRGKRKQVIYTLQRKLYHAKQVILLDADLDKLTLDYFAYLANSSDITWVENKYIVKDKSFIEYPTSEALQIDLLASIKAGLNCYVASDSRGLVKQLEAFLISKGQSQLLTVHSENSGQATQSAFISNVNEEQLKYQAVICSPSVSTGVDISAQHFDKVYLFANVAHCTSKDLLQAVARVRTVKEVNFWVDHTKKFEQTNWEKILESKEKVAFGDSWTGITYGTKVKKEKGDDIWAWEYDPQLDKPVVKDTVFMNMYCQLTASTNEDLNDLHFSFIEAAKKEGKVTKVKLTQTHDKLSQAVKEENKTLRKQLKQARKKAVLNAPNLTDEEYIVLSLCSNSLSQEEADSVKKYKLSNKLLNGLTQHLEYAVDNEKTIFKSVYLMGLLTTDDKELERQDIYDKVNVHAKDRKYRVKTKALIQEFLARIGYYDSVERGTVLSVVNVRASDISNTGTAFSWWATRNKVEIKELLGVTIKKDVENKPYQAIQEILAVLGLGTIRKQNRVKRKDILVFNPINSSYQTVTAYNYSSNTPINPEESVRLYSFYADKDSYSRMTEIIKARHIEKVKVEIPF
jgi:hypothetical protein